MARFIVGLAIERCAYAYVDAKDEKDPLKKARSFSNLIDECTEYEEIKDVEIIGTEEDRGWWKIIIWKTQQETNMI